MISIEKSLGGNLLTVDPWSCLPQVAEFYCYYLLM